MIESDRTATWRQWARFWWDFVRVIQWPEWLATLGVLLVLAVVLFAHHWWPGLLTSQEHPR